jgi:16S rRNA G966 N2-methylase RsmD
MADEVTTDNPIEFIYADYPYNESSIQRVYILIKNQLSEVFNYQIIMNGSSEPEPEPEIN